MNTFRSKKTGLNWLSQRMDAIAFGTKGTYLRRASRYDDGEPPDRTITDANAYSMQHQRRGTALIISVENFRHMPKRHGSNKDITHLKSALGRLGFDIIIKNDLLAREIKEEIQNVAKEDHSSADCFLCAFLTHGDDGVVYGSDSIQTDTVTGIDLQTDVFEQFRERKCTTLIGKPKIFLIQASKPHGNASSSTITGITTTESISTSPTHPDVEEGIELTVPSGSDFLICYSTQKGMYIMRDVMSQGIYIMPTFMSPGQVKAEAMKISVHFEVKEKVPGMYQYCVRN